MRKYTHTQTHAPIYTHTHTFNKLSPSFATVITSFPSSVLVKRTRTVCLSSSSATSKGVEKSRVCVFVCVFGLLMLEEGRKEAGEGGVEGLKAEEKGRRRGRRRRRRERGSVCVCVCACGGVSSSVCVLCHCVPVYVCE